MYSHLSVCLWSCSWWKAWTLRLHSRCRCPYSCSALASAAKHNTQGDQGLTTWSKTVNTAVSSFTWIMLAREGIPQKSVHEYVRTGRSRGAVSVNLSCFWAYSVAITPLANDRRHLISQYETPLSPRKKRTGTKTPPEPSNGATILSKQTPHAEAAGAQQVSSSRHSVRDAAKWQE